MRLRSVRIPALILPLAFWAASCSFLHPSPPSNRNLEAYNTLRVARQPYSSVWYSRMIRFKDPEVDRWLGKLRDERYNYVIVQVDLTNPKSPVENSSDSGVAEGMRIIFGKLAQYGLRCIPEIALGDSNWVKMNPRVQLNTLLLHGSDGDWSQTAVSYTEDSAGIDASFPEVLGNVRRAFAAATPGYPLEYVELGYDEFANGYSGAYPTLSTAADPQAENPLSYLYTLPGGAPPGRSLSYARVDREFLEQNAAHSTSWAVQALVVRSLYRRLGQVRQALGSEAKILIDADSFDPEFNGSHVYRAYNGDTVSFSSTLARLPGLDASEAATFKKGVILIPWNYFIVPPGVSFPYDADSAFSAFSAAGYKILYGVAVHNGDTSAFYVDQGEAAMGKYVDASMAHRNNALGYLSLIWGAPPYTDPRKDISGPLYDSVSAKGLIPRRSFGSDPK